MGAGGGWLVDRAVDVAGGRWFVDWDVDLAGADGAGVDGAGVDRAGGIGAVVNGLG